MTGFGQSARPGMGAIPYAGASGTGVTFRVWAGTATNVSVVGSFNGWNANANPLVLESNGVWSADVTAARAGDQYKYVMNGTIWRRDPRSARVVHAGDTDSIVYDHAAYAWQSGGFVPPPLESMVMYELHVGTYNDLNPNGGGSASLDDARERLDHLVELGVNAVTVMPITEFPGTHSWGYNPTDLYAVDNLTYGGPDAFKRFVDAAHLRGIAVILDIVHNHYGSGDLPGDLQFSLWEYDGQPGALGGGMYFYQEADKANTLWGPRPDYSRPQVRDFIKDNVRMWLRDYRVDGFRWDATKYIRSDGNGTAIADGVSLLREVNNLIASEFSNKISIAEDLDQLASTTAPTPGGLGFDSDWHTEIHHALTEEIAKTGGISTNRILDALNFGNHTRRLIYTESHDEAGHPYNDQVRVPVTMDPSDPDSQLARRKSLLAAGLMMTAPGIPMLFQGQEFLTQVPFYDTNSIHWQLTNTYAGILRAYQDLVRLRTDAHDLSGGLTGAYVNAWTQPLAFTNGSLFTMHRRNGGGVGDDVFVVANLSGRAIVGDWLTWPATGQWYAVFNSDDPRYSADFTGVGYADAFVFPDFRGPVSIGPWSLMVFARAPAPAVHLGMALAGTHNNWNPAANMKRIQQHEWLIDLELPATNALAFKFTADSVWTNNNWGTGTVAAATWPVSGSAVPWGGDFQVPIPADGTYRFTFNSASGRFTIRQLVPITAGASHPGMALAATFNGFNLAPNMTLTSNGVWRYETEINQPWDLEFKFAAYGTWNVSWGGDDVPRSGFPQSGIAQFGASGPSGGDLAIAGPLSGTYAFTFDDRTAAYTVERIGAVEPYHGMAIAGNFNGWSTVPNMTSNGLHQWSYAVILDQAWDLEFKFAANNTAYATSWSENTVHANSFPVHGTAVYGEAQNTRVAGPLYGVYTFTFNSDTLDYAISFAPFPARFSSMAVAGTLNGWNLAPNMTLDPATQEWVFEADLDQPGPIEFKFVTGGAWAQGNWGDTATHTTNDPATGTGIPSGANIVLPGPFDGTYRLTFNDNNLRYRVERMAPPFGFLGADSHPAGAGVIIRWESADGETYEISRGGHPNGPYDVLAPAISASPPMNTYTDTAPAEGTGFYRISVNP